jgi:hypothetical protein
LKGASAMNIYTPYTYLIGWSWLNTYYYGAEYGNGIKIANPSNLWVTYFTSSKYVKKFRELHGEPDIIQVRKTFETSSNTRLWEHKVLRRVKAVTRDDFLNKNNGSNQFINKGGYKLTQKQCDSKKGDNNVSKREDVKAKQRKPKNLTDEQRAARSGDNNVSRREDVRIKLRKPKSEITRQRMMKPKSKEHCLAVSKALTGKKKTAEHNRNNSLAKLGRKYYNNGTITKTFLPGNEPEGWVLGKINQYSFKESF